MSGTAVGKVRYRAHFHHVDRAALVAVSAGDGAAVGAARYVRHSRDRESAELAVEVVDEWQGGDVAAELLRRLAAHARAQGIRRLSAALPADGVCAPNRVVTLVCPEPDTLACEVPPGDYASTRARNSAARG